MNRRELFGLVGALLAAPVAAMAAGAMRSCAEDKLQTGFWQFDTMTEPTYQESFSPRRPGSVLGPVTQGPGFYQDVHGEIPAKEGDPVGLWVQG